MSKRKLPTDREVLQRIYDMYERSYPGARPGESDPYVAVDLPAVAAKLRCKPELLFGRLYYHLDRKHGYRQDGGALVSLFSPKVGEQRHAVHFPLLAAVLAGHNEERSRQRWTVRMSFAALVLSLVSLLKGCAL